MVEPVPPLLLTVEQITTALEDALAALGAAGGAIGGAIGGGIAGGAIAGGAGRAGGASGGAKGARWGTRKFTKLDGCRAFWSARPDPAALERLRRHLGAGLQHWGLTAPDGSPATALVSVVGAGSMNMNPCVIEAVWDSAGLQAVAHAREGLIKQNTCRRALDALQNNVFGPAGGS